MAGGEGLPVGGFVDVGEFAKQLQAKAMAGAAGAGFGEDLRRAPRHGGEEFGRGVAQADEPVAAVGGGAEDDVVRVQRGPRELDVAHAHVGAVGADDDDALGTVGERGGERGGEPLAEIAGALRGECPTGVEPRADFGGGVIGGEAEFGSGEFGEAVEERFDEEAIGFCGALGAERGGRRVFTWPGRGALRKMRRRSADMRGAAAVRGFQFRLLTSSSASRDFRVRGPNC